VSAEQPNIVVFWDNWGWGEVGCYGGGVLRGAPTLRIDASAVQAPCTLSRSALLMGRRPIRRPG
jgi:arylsulfatase A-like enzyme